MAYSPASGDAGPAGAYNGLGTPVPGSDLYLYDTTVPAGTGIYANLNVAPTLTQNVGGLIATNPDTTYYSAQGSNP